MAISLQVRFSPGSLKTYLCDVILANRTDRKYLVQLTKVHGGSHNQLLYLPALLSLVTAIE